MKTVIVLLSIITFSTAVAAADPPRLARHVEKDHYHLRKLQNSSSSEYCDLREPEMPASLR